MQKIFALHQNLHFGCDIPCASTKSIWCKFINCLNLIIEIRIKITLRFLVGVAIKICLSTNLHAQNRTERYLL